MLNLPDSLYEDYTQLSSASASASSSTTVVSPEPNIGMIFQWINDLKIRESDNLLQHRVRSDFALQNLADNRDNFEFLPLMLWNSDGTVAMLLGEVVKIYRHISLPTFSQRMPIRVYNVLLLFQRIALHPETRSKFLKANMPHYFYPLMDIEFNDKPLECIRLGALGVIAHMLKAPVDIAAIRFLMDTGALSYFTKPIEIGSTDSKTIAVFILDKILSTDEGLQYCCVLPDRFFAIDGLLKNLLMYLSSKPSPSLFNLVVACYFKLSQKSRARDGLRRYIPVMLFDGTFARLLAEDPVTDNYRKQLIRNLENKAM